MIITINREEIEAQILNSIRDTFHVPGDTPSSVQMGFVDGELVAHVAINEDLPDVFDTDEDNDSDQEDTETETGNEKPEGTKKPKQKRKRRTKEQIAADEAAAAAAEQCQPDVTPEKDREVLESGEATPEIPPQPPVEPVVEEANANPFATATSDDTEEVEPESDPATNPFNQINDADAVPFDTSNVFGNNEVEVTKVTEQSESGFAKPAGATDNPFAAFE